MNMDGTNMTFDLVSTMNITCGEYDVPRITVSNVWGSSQTSSVSHCTSSFLPVTLKRNTYFRVIHNSLLLACTSQSFMLFYSTTLNMVYIIYRPHSSYGKVMFSRASVILSVGWMGVPSPMSGGWVSQVSCPGAGAPPCCY